MKRQQEAAILHDLDKKMVILVGPRQAGKTWLSRKIGKSFSHCVYLNYDSFAQRAIIQEQAWLPHTDLLILDELPKMPDWKNYLKGLYDTKSEQLKLLVTGSSRMDTFAKKGDSLAGRYFLHHLLPFSAAELHQIQQPVDLEHLLNRGGFPEPFLAESDVDAARWRAQYINSLISTDVLEFDKIQNIQAMRLIFELLRRRVGSPISYQSIAEDVGVTPNTVKKYIEILEALYVIFRVPPYSNRIERSIKKEPKLYFFDTGLLIGDPGAKIENLTALSLYKHVLGLNDYRAQPYTLHYIRTKENKEIDFALAIDGNLEKLIEVKKSDKEISPTLKNFSEKYQVEAIQVVYHLHQERLKHGIPLLRLDNFLMSLYL